MNEAIESKEKHPVPDRPYLLTNVKADDMHTAVKGGDLKASAALALKEGVLAKAEGDYKPAMWLFKAHDGWDGPSKLAKQGKDKGKDKDTDTEDKGYLTMHPADLDDSAKNDEPALAVVVKGGATKTGTLVVLADNKSDDEAARWQAVDLGGDKYAIKGVQSGKFLKTANGKVATNTSLVIGDKSSVPEAQWGLKARDGDRTGGEESPGMEAVVVVQRTTTRT
eukprot:gene10094-8940_t